MEIPTEQHTSSVCDAATIKQEPEIPTEQHTSSVCDAATIKQEPEIPTEQHTSSVCDAATIKQEPEIPTEQHTSSVCDAATIKQEPVEAEPDMTTKQEIEYISVKEEGTPCVQEWQVPDAHDSTQDPLSIDKEECSPLEAIPGPSTSNIDKTEDEEYEEEPGSEDDGEDLNEEVELTSVGSEVESTIVVAVEDDHGTDDSGGMVTKQEAFCGNKSTKKQLVYYCCNICEKMFSHLQDLKEHTHMIHLEDKLSCSACHKTFSTCYDLKTHFCLHTGDRSYNYSICNTTFKSSN